MKINRGGSTEDDWTQLDKKNVIIESGWKPALWRCSIHILPLIGISIMAFINLRGYFVGTYYLGLTSPLMQSLMNMLLLLASQLMKSLIMLSSSMMLVDLLRRDLLHTREGLPLGLFNLLGGESSTQYLFSREFWSSTSAFRRPLKRIAVRLAITFATMLSVFAVILAYSLLVPVWDDYWPAGAANFTLASGSEGVYPAELNSSHTAGALCENPTSGRMRQQLYNDSICIWSGFNSIEQAVRAGYQSFGSEALVLRDSRVKREIIITEQGDSVHVGSINVTTLAYLSTPHLATAMAIDAVGQTFHTALEDAPSTLSRLSFRANWKGRYPSGTELITAARTPAVRTSCLPYSIDNTATDEASVQCVLGGTFTECPQILVPNTENSTTTVWIQPDQLGTNYTTSANSFLKIQLPHISSPNKTFFCVLEASWRQGGISSSTRNQTNEILFHQPYVGPYASRRIIRLTAEWLASLTPSFDGNEPSYTSLSALLDTAYVYWDDTAFNSPQLLSPLEAAISAFVLDGISRVGLAENWPLQPYSVQSTLKNLLTRDKGKTLDTLLDSKLLITSNMSNATSTSLRTYITITGLSYKMDGLTSWLALLFFVPYAVATIIHTVYCLRTRQTSSTYETVLELLMLFLASKADPDIIANTSGGMQGLRTFQILGKIRHISGASDPKFVSPISADMSKSAVSSSVKVANVSSRPLGEEVQVVFRRKQDPEYELNECSMVLPDVAYGRYEEDQYAAKQSGQESR